MEFWPMDRYVEWYDANGGGEGGMMSMIQEQKAEACKQG
jgi:hypothetical protein